MDGAIPVPGSGTVHAHGSDIRTYDAWGIIIEVWYGVQGRAGQGPLMCSHSTAQRYGSVEVSAANRQLIGEPVVCCCSSVALCAYI